MARVADLEKARSPYLILSEFSTSAYDQVAPYSEKHPELSEFVAFFRYVQQNYVELIRFENSQKILGIDSKAGRNLSEDWLYPNPRITILMRRGAQQHEDELHR